IRNIGQHNSASELAFTLTSDSFSIERRRAPSPISKNLPLANAGVFVFLNLDGNDYFSVHEDDRIGLSSLAAFHKDELKRSRMVWSGPQPVGETEKIFALEHLPDEALHTGPNLAALVLLALGLPE